MRMAKKKDSVQDAMPLADIQGNLAIVRDGSLRAFVRVVGANHSVYDFERKAGEALKTADILAAVPTDFAILRYPCPSTDSQQVSLIQKAIAREEAELSRCSGGRKRAVEKRLELIHDRLLAAARREEYGPQALEWKTWIALSWPPKTQIEEAMSDIEAVSRAAGEAFGSYAAAADEAEMRDLMRLYLVPQASSGPEPPIYVRIPTPDFDEREGRAHD